jgi:hypothetical protein
MRLKYMPRTRYIYFNPPFASRDLTSCQSTRFCDSLMRLSSRLKTNLAHALWADAEYFQSQPRRKLAGVRVWNLSAKQFSSRNLVSVSGGEWIDSLSSETERIMHNAIVQQFCPVLCFVFVCLSSDLSPSRVVFVAGEFGKPLASQQSFITTFHHTLNGGVDDMKGSCNRPFRKWNGEFSWLKDHDSDDFARTKSHLDKLSVKSEICYPTLGVTVSNDMRSDDGYVDSRCIIVRSLHLEIRDCCERVSSTEAINWATRGSRRHQSRLE